MLLKKNQKKGKVSNRMKFTAVGDYLVQRRLPPDYEGFSEIVEWMKPADARYFNLETTLHREGECFAFPLNGGSYLRADPEILEDCKRYGFNMTSFCNNHSMDFSYDGLLKTLEHVNKSGLVHAGTGMNLDQAAAPGYLDAKGGRVALIAMTATCNSVFNDVCIAGKQSRRVPGRPGVNQLRFQETLVVTPERMAQIKALAAETQVNAQEDIGRAEGFRAPLPEGQFKFGKYVNFLEGETTHKEVRCNRADLARMDKAIDEAKLQADYILVAIHSHEVGGTSKAQPAQFVEEFAHHCIDQGADAVIGHGPHLLRPIEIYKGKPIFYSLGDFVFHEVNLPFAPEEYFEAKGLTSDASMHEIINQYTGNFTRGLQVQPVMFEAVIPRWETENGVVTKLELFPIELGFDLPKSRNGLPAPAKDDSILRRLAEMSEPYGTKMRIENGVATVELG